MRHGIQGKHRRSVPASIYKVLEQPVVMRAAERWRCLKTEGAKALVTVAERVVVLPRQVPSRRRENPRRLSLGLCPHRRQKRHDLMVQARWSL